MEFKLFKRITIHWDGSDETAGEFGYGDYTKTEWKYLTSIYAADEKEARKAARSFCKIMGEKCYFSGVGFSHILEEVK